MLASRLETLIDERTPRDQDPEDRYITSGISWQHYETLHRKPPMVDYSLVDDLKRQGPE